MFNIEHKEIFPNLYHIAMDNQYELTSTFLRLQEFYESPYENIKGRYFSLEEYMDSYAKDQGNFTYTEDWNGFNVPGNIVVNFFTLYSYRLLKKEINLFKLLIDIIPNFFSGNFYLIGTHKNVNDLIDHEMAHGMFYLKEEYKKETLILNKENHHYSPLKDKLCEYGYCDEVIEDEIQAYMGTSSISYLRKKFKNIEFDKEIIKKYRKLFKRYKKKYVKN